VVAMSNKTATFSFLVTFSACTQFIRIEEEELGLREEQIHELL
jgi:hypothetical protein